MLLGTIAFMVALVGVAYLIEGVVFALTMAFIAPRHGPSGEGSHRVSQEGLTTTLACASVRECHPSDSDEKAGAY